MFSKRLMELLDFINDYYNSGDTDYAMAVRPHIMCAVEYIREDGKKIRHHQSIGIQPGFYDYFLSLPDRLVFKENAIKGTIKICTIGEMCEKGDI